MKIIKPKKSKFDEDLASRINKEVAKRKLKKPKIVVPKNIRSGKVIEICKRFSEYLSDIADEDPIDRIKKYKPTSEEITEFSKHLSEFTDYDDFANQTGCFLTELMHASDDNSFIIHVDELGLNYLGHKLNNKELTIIGYAGDDLGYKATNARITAENVGHLAGLVASNSTFIINGDVEFGVGEESESCEFYLRKNYTTLAEDVNSKFYRWENNNWEEIPPF